MTTSTLLLLLTGCGAERSPEPAMAPREEKSAAWDEGAVGGSAAPPPPASPAPGRGSDMPLGEAVEGGERRRAEDLPEAEAPEEGKDAPADAEASNRVRSWFPETFLWAPRVITGADGAAEVGVDLPDSLTTWRVLGLAASRDGQQAGAELSLLSTLPLYVDLLLPERVRLGDRWLVPVQVVNTTAEAWSGRLSVQGVGLSASAAGTVSVGARGSRVERAQVEASVPGPASLSASLAGGDAVQRSTRVEPTGRLVTQTRSGLLGAGNTAVLSAEPGAEYAELRLAVVPGPLGALRAELGRGGGSDVDDLAYSVALGAHGAALLTGLGAPPEAAHLDQLRTRRLLGQQGLVRAMRAPEPVPAALALDALRRVEADPVAERLAERLHSQLLSAQLPDGTWPVATGASLQQLLVSTALIAEALDDPRARVLASGAVERYAARLLDPRTGDAYTAAWVLKAGLASEELRAQLVQLIQRTVTPGPDGVLRVPVPADVVRPDGQPTSAVERLALCGQVVEDPLQRELLASVVAGYQPGAGFGDGWAGLAALDALGALSSEPPGDLTLVLRRDGVELRRVELRGAALQELAVVSAAVPTTGEHTYELVPDGAWPGLVWQLELRSWVPWTGGVGPQGLEVRVERGALALGQPVAVVVSASAPSGEAVIVRHQPPAGFRVDRASVRGGEVLRADDEEVAVRVAAGHGGLATLEYSATPLLQGSLSTGAATVALARDEGVYAAAPPARWTVP